MGGQFVVVSGADRKISHTLKKGSGDDMGEGDKKGMQGVQPTPGRYRVKQDHPGHGHSGVPEGQDQRAGGSKRTSAV